jgi:hypothetical protein
MKIRKKFLQLTKYTYPYGTEGFLESLLPDGYKTDKFGNYYLSVGDTSTTMFTCHLDTSCREMESVKHTFRRNYVMTDGSTILGADDKAGMVVILYMIEKKIPGLYYFFLGEEVGCIGSSALASELEKGGDVPIELKSIKKVVSFDRRGTTSVITDQFYGRCCSDKFAISLCSELNKAGVLNMRPDDTGVLTDSAQFMGIIPECTNISVGYYDEHHLDERQDITHLYNLCKSIESVNWETLPIERDPEQYNKYWSDGDWGEWDPYDDESILDKGVSKYNWETNQYTTIKSEFADYSDDLYTFVIKDGIRKKAFISQTWINLEILKISEMFKKQGDCIENIDWDGTSLWATRSGSFVREYVGSRSDLVGLIDHFDVIPIAHLKYDLVFVS